MQKVGLIAIAAVAVVAVIYAVTRPEPTPAERMSEAAQEAGDALTDTAENLAATTRDAAEALQAEAEDQLDSVQDNTVALNKAVSAKMAETSEEARQEIANLTIEWRETGIITDEGIDFDAAIDSVDTSAMQPGTKTQVVSFLEFLRDAPGDAKTKLDQLTSDLTD